jgi:hypothetical protein
MWWLLPTAISFAKIRASAAQVKYGPYQTSGALYLKYLLMGNQLLVIKTLFQMLI